MATYRAVVFDMDGVLIDAREWHYQALNEALSYFGFEIGKELHESVMNGIPTSKKLEYLSTHEGLPRHLHETISALKQDRTIRLASHFCYPNANHIALMHHLKRSGFAIGCATNSIRKTSELMLAKAGLLEYLDVLVTNEDVDNPKPDPEIYIKACSQLGVETFQAIAVEDNSNGLQSAYSAGLRVIEIAGVDDLHYALMERLLNDA